MAYPMIPRLTSSCPCACWTARPWATGHSHTGEPSCLGKCLALAESQLPTHHPCTVLVHQMRDMHFLTSANAFNRGAQTDLLGSIEVRGGFWEPVIRSTGN